jgi:hypothetical protein
LTNGLENGPSFFEKETSMVYGLQIHYTNINIRVIGELAEAGWRIFGRVYFTGEQARSWITGKGLTGNNSQLNSNKFPWQSQ